MGWDTVDELLAKYYGWQILTDKTLKVKHLKPIADIASTYHSRVNILNVSHGYDLTEWQEKNKHKLETYFLLGRV